MNDIKNSIITIIITVIVLTLCELLFVNNNHKNKMRLICGTVMLLSILSLFSIKIELENFDFSTLKDNTTSKTISTKTVATSLNYEIQSILQENDIKSGKVVIDVNIENESIIVNEVNILFDKEDKSKSEKIVNLIEKKLNIIVKAGEYNDWIKRKGCKYNFKHKKQS